MGFDIVLGNPPYGITFKEEEKKLFKGIYKSTGSRGLKGSMDSFVLFIEKGLNLLKTNGTLTYIVPISITSSDSVKALHSLIEKSCETIKISSYAIRPKPIFENAAVNTSILLVVKTNKVCTRLLTTKLNKKSKNNAIEEILENLKFANAINFKLPGRYPKVGTETELDILKKIFSIKTKVKDFYDQKGKSIYYRTAGGIYFKVIANYPTNSTKEKPLYIISKYADFIGALLSSNLFFWYYQVYSNCRDLKSYEIESFPVPKEKITDEILEKVNNTYAEYLQNIEKNAVLHEQAKYKNIDSFKEYKIRKSKHLIDKIDDLVGPLYGFTHEEIEFIKNYEIEFRKSDEGEEE